MHISAHICVCVCVCVCVGVCVISIELRMWCVCFEGLGLVRQVRLLVEEGNADVDCRDRWDSTPLDEARRMAAKSVIAFLENCDRQAGVSYCHLDMGEAVRPGCYHDPWPRTPSKSASNQPDSAKSMQQAR